MTVKELRELLKMYPERSEVKINFGSSGDDCPDNSEILDVTPAFPLFTEKDEYKVYLNTNEDFCKVKFEDGFWVVYGTPVEQAYHRTNFSTDAGVLRFMRILRYNGVEEKLKAAGIKDGDSVRICDYEFDYFD